MNSNRLIEMVAFHEKEHSKNHKIAIDSITIIRNGYMVADIYLNPLYPKDTEHIIHSFIDVGSSKDPFTRLLPQMP